MRNTIASAIRSAAASAAMLAIAWLVFTFTIIVPAAQSDRQQAIERSHCFEASEGVTVCSCTPIWTLSKKPIQPEVIECPARR